MTGRRSLEGFEWCEVCRHTHHPDDGCMVECVDCEADLVFETEQFLMFEGDDR